MLDYRAELDRRIAQFKHYLELMQQRRRGMGSEDCFIIFDDRADPDGPAADHLHESEALARESVLEGVVDGGTGAASLDETIVVDLPDEGWRGGESQLRFIQFRFNERSFDLDIPNTTLYRAEAEVVLRRRLGFFHAVERLDLEHPTNRDITKRFSPLRKTYVNGDESSAAEDMVFVWFSVWRFPVDWTFFVTASAFHGVTDWENGVPLA